MAASEISAHYDKGSDTVLKVHWKSGDDAWLSYHEISHLEAMAQYLEAQGVNIINDLPKKITSGTSIPIASMRPGVEDQIKGSLTDTVDQTISMAGSHRISGRSYRSKKDKRGR